MSVNDQSNSPCVYYRSNSVTDHFINMITDLHPGRMAPLMKNISLVVLFIIPLLVSASMALNEAIFALDIKEANDLIDQGADLDFKDDKGYYPIHRMMVAISLDKSLWDTPWPGMILLIDKMIKKDPRVSLQKDPRGLTLLHWLVLTDMLDVVNQFIPENQQQSLFTMTNNEGRTPLNFAMMLGKTHYFVDLYSTNSVFEMKDIFGYRPEDYLFLHGYIISPNYDPERVLDPQNYLQIHKRGENILLKDILSRYRKSGRAAPPTPRPRLTISIPIARQFIG